MSLKPFNAVSSRTIVLSQENIDTDQIIPARFLTTTSKKGLGKAAFYDWRYDSSGSVKLDSQLDGFDPAKFSILVAGSNFGCGSSREHAPWALLDFGFKAVISSDIADIFKSNALKNGLLPIEVEKKTHRKLLLSPGETVKINLEKQTISFGDGWRCVFDIDPFSRSCLLDGVDQLGFLLKRLPEIEAFEGRRA